MVRHIVMWKFKEGTQAQAKEFMEKLLSLKGQIPQIRAMEVGTDILGGGNYSAVLVSDFDSLEDVETYKNDPRHKAVSALCKSIRVDRVAVDYEF
ncbi:MAG: Dabb family protein [Christensenellaceae bacterium]|nr:Dabb family protein [Christensenellaceae bacterium]